MNNEALKPCPFCGSKAEIHKDGGSEVWDKSWMCKCTKCWAAGPKMSGSNSWASNKTQDAIAEKEAIEAWNTRAAQAEQPAAKESEYFWLCELMECDEHYRSGTPKYIAKIGRFQLTADPYKAARFEDEEFCRAICAVSHSVGHLFVMAVEHVFEA